MTFFFFCINEVSETFPGWCFCYNHRVLSNTIRILFEYLAYKLRFDIYFDRTVVISNYFVDVSVSNILLEFVVRNLFTYSAALIAPP